jgi:ATP phosphoribosyltransferase regulatory subunit
VGCELFGDASVDADIEILQVMLETLKRAQVPDVHLDLGHVGIYRAIAAKLGLAADDEAALFDILQRKSQPDLVAFGRSQRLDGKALASLAQLMDLNGDVSVLKRAEATLGRLGSAAGRCLDTLERTVRALKRKFPKVPVHIDLAELRGYRYQTGMVFAAFAPGHGRELARGGRYDGVGREFGVPRPATGFSADLNELLRLSAKN